MPGVKEEFQQYYEQQPEYTKEFGYKVEEMKLRTFWGVRKIVWIFIIIFVLLWIPAYLTGKGLADLYYKPKIKDINIVVQKDIKYPEYYVGDTEVLLLGNNQRDLYVKVSNKLTTDVGYSPWVYTYQLTDKLGTVLKEDVINSYLLPNNEKYIIVTTDDANAAKINIINNRESSFPVEYDENYTKFSDLPEIKIYNKKAEDNILDSNYLDLSCQIRNDSDTLIKKVEVLFIMRDKLQEIIGITKIVVPKLDAGEQKDVVFKNYPKPTFKEVSILDIRTSYNYLDEGTFELK